MQPIHTVHDFFLRSGAQLRLFHMGRRVTPFGLDTLAAFENGTLPWPQPWRSQARMACVFTLGDSPEPIIWFLAMPLDEQGHLMPAPRDAFVQRLLETLGRIVERQNQAEDGAAENLMEGNPLSFEPSLPFRAMLHARATRAFDRPASQHLELVEAYLQGQQDEAHWQALGLQGMADYVIRQDTEQSRQLADRLDALPSDVVRTLCYCLEHEPLDESLVIALRARGEAAAQHGDVETLCACVRAVGTSVSDTTLKWYDALLADTHASGPDLLAAMAARGWEHLEDAERLPRFLQRLAEHPGADFLALVRDLALIPRLRLPVLMSLREAPADSAIGQRLAALHQA
ncbi:DUF3549 family protein [Litchfieldella xinjiangensis]|uniref:DUF3549 family protein n=1 Tax=Litchfieldella xinjiangensis TaxID=1166948 RepID=UPI0005B79BDB|nr:DUF3549 family protein [Halomonas xinjiangensis]